MNRTATAWLIRRFLDRDAEISFVEPEEAAATQRTTGAIGFDAPGAKYPHKDERGRCSFEQLVEEHLPQDAALQRLARIVHGADFPEEHRLGTGVRWALGDQPGLHGGGERRRGDRGPRRLSLRFPLRPPAGRLGRRGGTSRPEGPVTETDWYVFMHQLPPKPLYLRAKVLKLLARAGAVPLKNSVHVLPLREGSLPALERISAVALSGGGDTHTFRARPVGHPSQEQLVRAFQRARDEDYRELTTRLRRWQTQLAMSDSSSRGPFRIRLGHARRRLQQIVRVDFFQASRRGEAEAALRELEARLAVGATTHVPGARDANRELVGRTWVTRRGIQVDRIASAWLVRRFIDTKARFRFIDLHEEQARAGELTFDMMGADFTHEEDRCTFETLVRRIALGDAALARVAEIVHDIDIKDGKFGRPEARGIEQLLCGMLAAHPDDEARFERGSALLDDLYQSFSRQLRAASTAPGLRDGEPGQRPGGKEGGPL